MDTFLYIVIAVAIMAYQIYNEKKKKEQKKDAINRPPVKRVDPNEELQRDLSQMFGSLSGIPIFEDDESGELNQEFESDPHDFISDMPASKAAPVKPVREKYKPEIVSTETLGAEAYNVDVPINKTEAETTQLLHDIYDNSAIYSDEIDGQSNKEREKEDKDFDPKLFILYSEIAQPKFKD
ncbi:MAG: hypothetical protein WCR71_02340 [Bacteroidales bacterium]